MSLLKKYLPEVIYGGMDGSITTFAIVAGAYGAGFSTNIIITLGIANLFADGFAMAVGNYLSTQAMVQKSRAPINTALATFLAFVCIGTIPLISYILSYLIHINYHNVFFYACLLTIVAFLVIGYLKSNITQTPLIKAIIQTLLLGCIASLISFLLGFYLEGLLTAS